MLWKAALILLLMSLCLADIAVPVQAASLHKESPAETKAEQKNSQENEIRKVLIQLAAAANGGDAVGTASLWTEDAVFIDEDGTETRGRSALQERFASTLKERGTASIELHPERITLPAANVALLVGSVSRKSANNDLPATRFSMAMVKQNDSWLISEATETRMQDLKAADYLRELEWLIGKWQVDKPDNAAKLELNWGAGRNFIISKCITGNSGVEQVDTQIIGWDPRSKGIVSWHFDCNGGFGYGKWIKQANGWLVDFSGVACNGGSTRATNVFSIKSPDEFLWQSSAQSSDGVAIADTEALKVRKLKP